MAYIEHPTGPKLLALKGTTNGTGVVVKSLAHIRKCALVEVAAIDANLMFQWWPTTETGDITTIAGVTGTSTDPSVTLNVAERGSLKPGYPIDVLDESNSNANIFRGHIHTRDTDGGRYTDTDLKTGAGNIFACNPLGIATAFAEGDHVRWQLPVFDSSNDIYCGFLVNDGLANAQRFRIPHWAGAIAFIRTASTNVNLLLSLIE